MWHVGDLDVSKKYSHGTSMEGNLFSMSACPDAWQTIAKLGGNPLHKTGRPVVMLDMREVLYGDSKAAKAVRSLALKQAEARGYIEKRTVYEVCWDDDELDTRCSMLLRTMEEAEEEVRDEPPAPKEYICTTPLLNMIHGWPEHELRDGLEFAVVEWARGISVLDGVYWDEELDPSRYTAPRAGMFSTSDLGLEIDTEALDDQDRLCGVSSQVWISTHGRTRDHDDMEMAR